MFGLIPKKKKNEKNITEWQLIGSQFSLTLEAKGANKIKKRTIQVSVHKC